MQLWQKLGMFLVKSRSTTFNISIIKVISTLFYINNDVRKSCVVVHKMEF